MNMSLLLNESTTGRILKPMLIEAYLVAKLLLLHVCKLLWYSRMYLPLGLMK